MADYPAQRITDDLRLEIFRHGSSQQEVAQRSGLSKSAVSRRLTGEVDITVRELENIAGAVDLSVVIKLVPAAVSSPPSYSSGPVSPEPPMNATPTGSDEHTSPAATTGAAAPHVDVALAGETATRHSPAGQTGKARDQLAAASTRAFPAIVERPE